MLEYFMIDNIFVVIGGRSFNKDLAFFFKYKGQLLSGFATVVQGSVEMTIE
jgi:hypothetical protein